MPTALGVLPSNKPLPSGVCQIMRGAIDGAITVSGAGGAGMTDGQGRLMQIAYTPSYACWWQIKANVMWIAASGSPWRRVDYSINISPGDANGVTYFQIAAEAADGMGWRHQAGNAMFKLNPGVAYNVWLAYAYSGGNSQQYHTSPYNFRLLGRVLGEGVL